jgi:hypothetical protein
MIKPEWRMPNERIPDSNLMVVVEFPESGLLDTFRAMGYFTYLSGG